MGKSSHVWAGGIHWALVGLLPPAEAPGNRMRKPNSGESGCLEIWNWVIFLTAATPVVHISRCVHECYVFTEDESAQCTEESQGFICTDTSIHTESFRYV
jgi:hypothetical protein